ncbi:permease prefix domain 1-containing protein [Evansella halocellulosilytica]|uniref:permease prefix domain 1-containing protein n=1 Tax=Evansella halocellulosilytica TaxID=2011013 RepID=UPI000BB6BFB6|nr:permease prefix domain 1-containing protein [Evansella halocellulosilytica]
MKNIKHHVDELFKDVPKSERREIIKEEIKGNLEEKITDLMEQGKEEEDAINKAIIEFGDIEDIKSELGVNNPQKKNQSKLNLGFSIWGSFLFIALVVFMNFYYTPDVIWFVYPTFVVLWWPLSMLYYWLRTK